MSEKKPRRPVTGWLILDKPHDMTSTEAVGKVRWLFSALKAGHAGTLDPLATGVLPIALGEATKTVPQAQDGTKVYRFGVRWGSATATDDAEGEVVATSEARPDRAAIEALLPRFTGAVTQIPPAFSAIRVAGERAYDLARAGEKVELEPRVVEIEALTLLEASADAALFEVVCGKGTYVRALARDMAVALGTCGHVSSLRRTRVGPFLEATTVQLAALEAADLATRDGLLLPPAAALAELPEIRLDARQAAIVRLGNPVLLGGADAPVALPEAWASHRGGAVATGYVEAGQFKPKRVLLG